MSEPELFHEDFAAGTILPLEAYAVTREEVIEFAAEYDPQPFHLDEEAAKDTLLGGLSASGWHNCAMMMRMMFDGYLGRSSSQGAPSVEYVRWLRPVRPGDTLSGVSEVLDSRRLASRPGLGIARIANRLDNQAGERVLEAEYTLILRTRGGPAA